MFQVKMVPDSLSKRSMQRQQNTRQASASFRDLDGQTVMIWRGCSTYPITHL